MSSYRNQTALRQAEAGAAVCAYANVDLNAAAAVTAAANAVSGAASALDSSAVVRGLTSDAVHGLQTLAPMAWPKLSQALANGASALTLASTASEAFAEAERSLGVAARDALVDTVLEFVKQGDQGFAHVEVAQGEHVTAIHAVRVAGGETVIFQVDDRGGLEHEYAGHAGTSCEVRAAEFEAFARTRGIELDTRTHEVRKEGDPDGARMILDAVRRDAEHPARGAMLNAEHPRQVRARSRRPGIFESSITPSAKAARTQVGGAV